jgi:hypothetical protein
MPDAKTRLLEARRTLRRLELRIEQYRIHIAELVDPRQAERERAALARMQAALEVQRRCCHRLAKAAGAGAATEKRDA